MKTFNKEDLFQSFNAGVKYAIDCENKEPDFEEWYNKTYPEVEDTEGDVHVEQGKKKSLEMD